MDRRTFLTALAAPLAAKAGGLNNPFFAFCMDTNDAKKRTLAGQADLLKELGYDGAGHLWFDNLSERIATLDRDGLRLFQVYMRIDVSPAAPQPYDPGLRRILPLLEGRDVQLAALMQGGSPSDMGRDARAVQLVREIADAARPFGVRLALYPHAGLWLEKVRDSIRIARQSERGNVGVMFNLCHWLKTGDESQLEPLLESALPFLIAVSVNGADRGAEIKAGTGNWIQPLDSGSFDIFRFLKILRDLRYAGPVGLQCYGLAGDARVHLARSMRAWRMLRDHLRSAQP